MKYEQSRGKLYDISVHATSGDWRQPFGWHGAEHGAPTVVAIRTQHAPVSTRSHMLHATSQRQLC